MPELSDKRHERFCREYIIDFNGAKAAIRAGFAKRSAAQQASRLLTKDNIKERIKELQKERLDRLQLDADYVLYRHFEVDRMDAKDILDDNENVRPISEWPAIWRQMISGFDVKELIDSSDKEEPVITILKKIKWPDKIKNLQLLGQHVNIQAYKEKKEVEHTGDALTRLIEKIDGQSLGPPALREGDNG